ncbi:unnamed protein product [Miscanthus lutarioriparius]|uniref:Uncharacterized protein n=1 Tax=Miscanthus lutarioriparius TaxID=422564 RepID=A0A811S0K2_9POAL|nr:unnamed protein product [Miscanthus lutarioriparius]
MAKLFLFPEYFSETLVTDLFLLPRLARAHHRPFLSSSTSPRARRLRVRATSVPALGRRRPQGVGDTGLGVNRAGHGYAGVGFEHARHKDAGLGFKCAGRGDASLGGKRAGSGNTVQRPLPPDVTALLQYLPTDPR